MTYLLVENFNQGLETRRSVLTAPAGSVLTLRNAAIDPGGEIVKRRAFVKIGTNLLAGTFGLAAIGNNVTAFTRNATVAPPALNISGYTLNFQNLVGLTSTTAFLTDWDVFDGKLYVALADPGGTTPAGQNPHFFDGAATGGAGKGYYVRSFKSKVYAVVDKYLSFCAVADPTNWSTGTGAGFINLSLQETGGAGVQGLEIYYDKLAVMSDSTTQIWSMDADPLKNQLVQTLRATGTRAPLSVQQYGSGDVLFLSPSGIRSLKARDASNSAAVTDIGSPVDEYVKGIRQRYNDNYLYQAKAILEPIVGRFWMVFPTEILVLSYFPGPKITAWSVFTTPFNIDYVVTAGDRIFIRSGNDLYVYGGADGQAYDNTLAEVRLPYLDAQKPGHMKQFLAMDATVSGTWDVAVSFNYDQPDVEDYIGSLTSPTWSKGRIAMQGYSSHASLRFKTTYVGESHIANCALHYSMADDET